ncbi:hypothetical protein AMEX_G27225, partial [Astyanax mexicanus]
SGEEVELRVRAGSDVTIFSDCVSKDKFNLAWFRNCSHHHQPRLVLLPKYMVGNSFPRFSLELNSSNQTYDLLVKNISESDLGLYYCATYKQQITNKKTAGIRYEDVFHYGNRTTRLFLLEMNVFWFILPTVEKNAEKKRRNALNITDLAKVTMILFQGVWFSRISVAEVKKRVRLGDNVTLYCDCVVSQRTNLAWFRNCSDDSHPPLLLKSTPGLKQHFPHFSFVRNSSSRTYDLLVKKISEKDLAIYYCARIEKKGTNNETVYHYGKLTTKLYLKGKITASSTFCCL